MKHFKLILDRPRRIPEVFSSKRVFVNLEIGNFFFFKANASKCSGESYWDFIKRHKTEVLEVTFGKHFFGDISDIKRFVKYLNLLPNLRMIRCFGADKALNSKIIRKFEKDPPVMLKDHLKEAFLDESFNVSILLRILKGFTKTEVTSLSSKSVIRNYFYIRSV